MKTSRTANIAAGVFVVIVSVAVSRSLFVPVPPPFNFRYFESLHKDNEKIDAARQYLESKYPVGSDVMPAVHELQQAGAKCLHDDERHSSDPSNRAEYFGCYYTTHNLSASLSSLLFGVEWKLFFSVDDANKIQAVRVGRGITGA